MGLIHGVDMLIDRKSNYLGSSANGSVKTGYIF